VFTSSIDSYAGEKTDPLPQAWFRKVETEEDKKKEVVKMKEIEIKTEDLKIDFICEKFGKPKQGYTVATITQVRQNKHEVM